MENSTENVEDGRRVQEKPPAPLDLSPPKDLLENPDKSIVVPKGDNLWQFVHSALAEFRYKNGKLQQCFVIKTMDNTVPSFMRTAQAKYHREWKDILTVPDDSPDIEAM